MKTAVPSLSRRANANIQKALGRYNDDCSCSLKDNTRKLSSTFQRKATEQSGIGGNVVGRPKSPLSNKLKGQEKEQNEPPSFWKERDQIIKKKAYDYFSIQL